MERGESLLVVDRARRLFTLYEQKMYRVAFAVLHDEARAEDAVMDAFEKILKRPFTMDPSCDEAKKLVLSVLKSTSIDLYRKQARERQIMVYPGDSLAVIAADYEGADSAVGVESAGCAGGVNIDPLAGFAGMARKTHQADIAIEVIESLPKHYQDVLRNRIIEEKSVKETAENLGISQTNVRKRQQRALEALRRQMGVTNGI